MDAIIQVVEDWSLTKEQKQTVLAIFFDFSKAFDLVDHEIILLKLLKHGLPPWLISWIASYLLNRSQRDSVNVISSDWKKVEAGVIQRSILGPILFLIFIMDINKRIPTDVTL